MADFAMIRSGLGGLEAPGPISITALIPCSSLPTVNAWELGDGYSVADSVPGQGGILTEGGVSGQEPHSWRQTQ